MTSPTGEKKHTSDDRVGPEAAANVPTSRDLLLIALTVASGAVDVISYFGLGKIFSAFMTGNIVFLGFGIAEIKVPDIFALSMFAVGSYLGLRITARRTQLHGLWPRAASLVLAFVVITEAGFLAVRSATAGRPTPNISDVLIVLFSLAMGLQTAAVRWLGVQGVFTTAATFTLVAFAAPSRDPGRGPRSHASAACSSHWSPVLSGEDCSSCKVSTQPLRTTHGWRCRCATTPTGRTLSRQWGDPTCTAIRDSRRQNNGASRMTSSTRRLPTGL
jgi:uncharacterized membrane protein YoaK (UPF0700 family)